MSFFSAKDFEVDHCDLKFSLAGGEMAAQTANAKLEREGKVVYLQSHESGDYLSFKERDKGFSDNSRALLIAIEPIEQCKHPSEKVQAVVVEFWDKAKNYSSSTISDYRCECGAKVKPSTFEVCE